MSAESKRIGLFRFLFVCLLMLSPTATHVLAGDTEVDEGRRQLDRAQEWEHAAIDREMTSVILQNLASELLAEAEDLSADAYFDEIERVDNFRKAGENQRKAGEVEAIGADNYEAAVEDWTRSASEYTRFGDTEKARKAKDRSAEALKNALAACNRAASAYELAAQSFGEKNGDNPIEAAKASEKAAKLREKLADKK